MTPHEHVADVVRSDRTAADVGRHRRLVRRVVRRAVGPAARHEVDDIAQEVMVALWKQLARGRAIEHPAAYLYRAATREARRAVARLRRRATEPLDGMEPVASGLPADPMRHLVAHEQRAALRAALGALAPDRRLAVRAHLAGRSVREIMADTGWPYQRARNLIARGMADVRAALR